MRVQSSPDFHCFCNRALNYLSQEHSQDSDPQNTKFDHKSSQLYNSLGCPKFEQHILQFLFLELNIRVHVLPSYVAIPTATIPHGFYLDANSQTQIFTHSFNTRYRG
jgi:hypothetical protein